MSSYHTMAANATADWVGRRGAFECARCGFNRAEASRGTIHHADSCRVFDSLEEYRQHVDRFGELV